jgi:hypothetical protein
MRRHIYDFCAVAAESDAGGQAIQKILRNPTRVNYIYGGFSAV